MRSPRASCFPSCIVLQSASLHRRCAAIPSSSLWCSAELFLVYLCFPWTGEPRHGHIMSGMSSSVLIRREWSLALTWWQPYTHVDCRGVLLWWQEHISGSWFTWCPSGALKLFLQICLEQSGLQACFLWLLRSGPPYIHDLAFPFPEHHEVPVSPFSRLTEVLLYGSMTLECINHSSMFCVIRKWQNISENIKKYRSRS